MFSWKYYFFLFFITFFIFNLNLNSLGSSDTIPARLLPINILSGRGLYFDYYVNFLQNKHQTIYYLKQFDNHYISFFPVLPGLIATPFYVPFYFILNLNNTSDINSLYNISTALQKLSASFLSSISVILFFILIKKISNKNRLSFLFALIFAFASQTFSISSQALWQHGIANLFLIASQVLLIKAFSQKNEQRRFFLTSLFLGVLSFWSRPVFSIYLILLLVMVIFNNRKNFVLYFISTAIGVLVLLFYNLYFYQSLFGGYGNVSGTLNSSHPLSNFLGLFFSPARGLIFYTPFYIFSFLSILFINQINRLSLSTRIVYYLNYIYLISGLCFYSFWGIWWGGHSWGDRLLTDLAVSASILIYFFYIYITNNILRIIFFIFIIYSIVIQSIGVFFYINSKWDTTPLNVDSHIERLWDFNDNPISRSINAGPDLRRFYFLISKLY